MANELCATGFNASIAGQYNLMYTDHWRKVDETNGIYWIYKDSYYWMISTSEFLYETGYVVARKAYVAGSWADGNYTGVNGNPSGVVTLGVC
jgi:hypothetical protein